MKLTTAFKQQKDELCSVQRMLRVLRGILLFWRDAKRAPAPPRRKQQGMRNFAESWSDGERRTMRVKFSTARPRAKAQSASLTRESGDSGFKSDWIPASAGMDGFIGLYAQNPALLSSTFPAYIEGAGASRIWR
jgi:hypothetical protein